jgi:hypothetical protein
MSAFGFLASRLPCCLLPLPMIVHPAVVPRAGSRRGSAARLAARLCQRIRYTPCGAIMQAPNARRVTRVELRRQNSLRRLSGD